MYKNNVVYMRDHGFLPRREGKSSSSSDESTVVELFTGGLIKPVRRLLEQGEITDAIGIEVARHPPQQQLQVALRCAGEQKKIPES